MTNQPKDKKQMLLDNAHALTELLPPTIANLACAIGLDGAMAVVESFGGLDMVVPKQPTGVVWESLVATLGGQKAAAVVATYGGERIYINRCEPLKKIIRDQLFMQKLHALMETGVTQTRAIKELAIAFDISERYCYEIVRGFGGEKVVDLFDY